MNSAVDMASQTAKGLLKTFALTMIGGLTSGVTSTETMLIICPEHAAILAAGGYSKAAIRQRAFCRSPACRTKKSRMKIWNCWRSEDRFGFSATEREVGAVDRPEDIWIVVAGGEGAKSAYIPGRTGTHLQTTAVASRSAAISCSCT